jgi:hypothetical protein
MGNENELKYLSSWTLHSSPLLSGVREKFGYRRAVHIFEALVASTGARD